MSHAQPALGSVRPAITPFRRSRVAPPRRRRNRWSKFLRPLLGPTLLLAAVTGIVVWLLTSSQFAVAQVHVDVDGLQRISAGWVAGTLSPLVGENLLRLRLSRVEALVTDHPWIAGVTLHKEPPGNLRVAVIERLPAALIEVEGETWYAEASGRPIAPRPAEAGDEGLPLVRSGRPGPVTESVPPALAVARELAAARPRWAAGLVEIEALGDEDFVLKTDILPFPLLVRAGAVGDRIDPLEELLPEILRRYDRLRAVDLRFSRRIVLQPEGTPSAGGA